MGELRHVAPHLGFQVKTGLHLRFLLYLRPKIAKVDRCAVPIGCRKIFHLRVQIGGGQVERDGTIVQKRDAMHQFNLLRAQVQQRVQDRLVALRGVLGDGLVGLAALVDDEVNVRLLHPQQVEPDV